MKDFQNIVSFMWKYMKPHKYKVFLFVIVFFADRMITMANTLLLGTAIDNMLVEGTMDAIIKCALVFLGMNMIALITCYFAKVKGTEMIELCRVEAKCQLSEHIERTSLKYCGTVGSMTFMQRMNYDSAMLVYFITNASGKILSHSVIFLSALIIIFQIDVVCGVAVMIEIPIIIGLYLGFRNEFFERSRVSAAKGEKSVKQLYELLADTRHIKKNQIFSILNRRYRQKAQESVDAILDVTKLDYIYSILEDNMDIFLKVFLFFYGGLSVIKGEMTVGNFMIVYTYFASVTSSCAYFLNLGKEIQDHKAYYERLKEITDVPEETNGTLQLEKIHEIRLSHVNFGYNEKEKILKDFSYTFQKGNLYVIAGGNGTGKSTITALLLGMYIDEVEGEVTYNGHSIKELDMRKLRRNNIGVCEQEPYLIEDTIRYNMTYSNETTVDEILMQLAHEVSFDGFLMNSELGLDTLVGEAGNALSGGQKQKTALVKVFYKNPDVIVLDEPTSAMDAEGQERLIRYLNECKKDKIIIVITHDKMIMKVADEVIKIGE